MKKIGLVLLTGFLGSGKTTMLQAIIQTYRMEKIGVIVNEFGEVNIDGSLIDHDGIKLKELSNGSIFCACLKEDFIKSLVAISAEDISLLFIEASGLSDPANFPEILHSISKLTDDAYDYRGSICVVDALTFQGYLELLPALHQQVAYSSSILVNKMDLVDLNQLSDTIELLSAINQEAEIEVTKYCKADYKRIINGLVVPKTPNDESTNTYETRPKSFLLTSDQILPFDQLIKFLNDLSPDSYRIKGFANTTKGDIYISGTNQLVETRPWEGVRKDTSIVIISSIGIRMMSKITMGLSGDLKGILHI
jgi:G3E family GTPase